MIAEAKTHAETARKFSHFIAHASDWDAATPVPEWRARDIVEHLLTWPVPVLAAWAQLDLVDDASDSLLKRWQNRTAEPQAALEDPTVANRAVSEGPFAGQPVCVTIDRVYTADVYMHTWDLARATNQPADLDPNRAQDLLDGLQPMEEVLRSSGQYGTAHPTGSNNPVDQLVAFIGRDPRWEARTNR